MATHIPSEFIERTKAHVIVGCTSESASKVYFNANDAIKEAEQHQYLAFFDAAGDKMSEVKVMYADDGSTLLADEF